MLSGATDTHSKPGLYRWRRESKGPASKPAFDYDNVEHWIKRVEQASEFAVSEVFAPKKPARRAQREPRPVLDLESTDQLHDHDDAYTEAQDLLSEWLSNKLTLELGSEEDDEPEDDTSKPTKPPPPEFVKYNRFDDLYHYLEQETENSNAQDFMQQLLQKEVVDSGILRSLRSDQSCKPAKRRDPRVTMEVRHQQVKENRARRQRETEKQRQTAALKKSALTQAQKLVQEESRQKALRAKKEDEEIQREMVKLRKEMNERKRTMEEARKIEWERQELENKRALERLHTPPGGREHEPERRRLEKHAKIQELLSQVYAENHRCLQKHFSIWYKLVLERRVKMGKARALADWKHQQRTFRAWRHHVWTRKLERETQQMEVELRDQNRKQQVAAECYQKRLLRHCLTEWQLYCRAEKEKRELEARKEETKRKMAALLDAASSLGSPKPRSENQMELNNGASETTEKVVEETRSVASDSRTPVILHRNPPEKVTSAPRHAWQVTRQHAALTSDELEQHRLHTPKTPQRSGHQGKPASSGENFENRHLFQKEMIEEQRRQLEEQKQMILGLMENQRLMICKQEAKRASAVTAELSAQVITHNGMHRAGGDPSMEGPSHRKQEAPCSLPFPSEHSNTSPAQSTVSTARKITGASSPHPVVRAMEERAAQRAERKRLLEETRRRREEEKLAQLRAAESQRLEMEAAEKESQLERKREEKRLQRQKEEEKQRRLQRERDLSEKARLHHEKRLLKFWGLGPWKKLVAQSRQDMERAASHYRLVLLRGGLLGWLHAVREMEAERNQRAEQLADTLLLRRTFQQWMKYKDYLSVQEERADRRHKANLRRKTFTAWLNLVQEEKLSMWEKQRSAAEHNQRRVLLTALRTWSHFPKFMRELRLKEERRQMLRQRVAEILPDFRLGPES
ncbi:coiled-coil domain-containing protein 191 [Pseudophryne corroboree]|uniref:coiled-coil domain-containing protein 191 n=1 Tax=Pseudophryne corroboree TaxID=495146 RepID=UPI003081CFB0